jgi:hypothetical protein
MERVRQVIENQGVARGARRRTNKMVELKASSRFCHYIIV